MVLLLLLPVRSLDKDGLNRLESIRILEFLDLEVDDQSFDCMMRHQDGIYKRRKRLLSFEPFNAKLKDIVDKSKAIVDQAIKENLAGIYHIIKEYLAETYHIIT